ncbi:MAG: CDP-alcohol phosphatidyltransferase family protein [Verrucomicrobia bacterium]|nr:MAG: CDP-alcohol phosphatidyltransferase family protein [Verrucomicrobiota bacterium]
MRMTTANKVTIARILLVPVFVIELMNFTGNGREIHRLVALTVFLLAAIGDGIDGFIARRYHQRTELGALLDPLADKLLLVLGLVILSLDNRPWLDRVPLWLTATVLARDVLLLLLLVLVNYLVGRGRVRPRWTGKVATVLQMTTVVWVLASFPSDWIVPLAAAATGFTALSGAYYLWDGWQMLRQRRA